MTADTGARQLLERTGAVGRAALGVAAALRAAFDELLPHEAIGVRSLGRALGVGRTLAWQCHRMAYSTELDGVLSAVLGDRGLRRTLEALERRGVSETKLARIRSAWSRLSETMRTHRIDRASLRAMTAGLGESGFADLEALRVRRAAQRGNAQLWGIGVRATIATQIFVPRGDSLDLAALVLHDGLRTFAEIGPLRLHAGVGPGATSDSTSAAEAMAGTQGTAPLVGELCTPGAVGTSLVLPESPAGAVDLEPSQLGQDPLRIAIGEILRGIGSPWAEDGEGGDEAFMRYPVGLPVEMLVMVVGLHRSLPKWHLFELLAKSAVWRDRGPTRGGPGLPMPIDGSIVPTGGPSLPRSLADLEAPWKTLLSRGAESLGSSLDEFGFTRALVECPVMTSAIRLRWRLPTRPGRREHDDATR